MTAPSAGMQTTVLTGPGPSGMQRGNVVVTPTESGHVLTVIGVGERPISMLQMTPVEARALAMTLVSMASLVDGGAS